MKFKKGIDRNQEFLFAKKPEDFLSENHLARAIHQIVMMLDVSNIENKYSEIGQNAYDPRMMIRILFNGYSIGIRSSRMISKGCEDRFDFVYLAEGLKPSHDRISDFRKDNLAELKDIFKEIVLIGANLGLVRFGNIKTSIDGSKIRANASPKLSKDEEGLKRLLDKTQKEIDRIFEEADRIDEEEDKKYGKENRGDELPENLRSNKSREKAIKEAIEKLKKQKEAMKDKIREEKGREPTKSELVKIEKRKMNVTDNDAKMMKEKFGLIKPGYNAQISVDEKEQFILANDVTDEANDNHQLIPMLNQTRQNTGESPKQAIADNGYHVQLNEAAKLYPETDLYVDDKNRRKKYINFNELKQKYSKAEYNNLIKILSPEGEKKYKKRMSTAEPPFGNLKHNRGFRYFLLRGLGKVKGEFNLMCIGHNLNKIVSFMKKNRADISSTLKNIRENMKINKKTRLNGCAINLCLKNSYLAFFRLLSKLGYITA